MMIPRRLSRRGYTLIEALVVIGILGLLIGLTLPAVQKIRGAAQRSECSNNMRQVGLALSNYHSVYNSFPRGIGLSDLDREKMPYGSWHVLLLPFIEQDAVWLQAVDAFATNPTAFMDLPHPFTTVIQLYGCPADSRTKGVGLGRKGTPVSLTSYLGVSGVRTSRKDGIFFSDSHIGYADIVDGTSNTLMVGERPPSGDLWYGWWYAGAGSDGLGRGDMLLGVKDVAGGAFDPYVLGCPTKSSGFVNGSIDNLCDAFHFWSFHSGGANFLFADGSVRFMPYAANEIMPALATRAGGEAVSWE